MRYDVIVTGAGLVGLATAYAMLTHKPGLKLLVIEKESSVARHQSGHNSGVLHSGVYYQPGSLKARNCRDGYSRMLDFLRQEKIPYRLCGKLIVATSEIEQRRLRELQDRGMRNGLQGLELLSAEQTREREPLVYARESLWVPQAGIVDYGEVARVLEQKIRTAGGAFLFDMRVLRFAENAVVTAEGLQIAAANLVNCAGLHSDRLAPSQQRLEHRIVPFRGEYYRLRPEAEKMLSSLVYPVPDPRFPFLGVHFTPTIDGHIEAGPNAVLALSREGYRWSQVNVGDIADYLAWPGLVRLVARHWRAGSAELLRSLSKKLFVKSLQKLVPDISEEDLIPGGAGVRAQALDRAGNLIDDFVIEKVGNQVHVVNAPSPGATSSLAIGEHINRIAFD